MIFEQDGIVQPISVHNSHTKFSRKYPSNKILWYFRKHFVASCEKKRSELDVDFSSNIKY